MAIIRNYLNFLDYVDALLVESQFESASHKGKWVDHKAWLTSLYKIQNSSLDHKKYQTKGRKTCEDSKFFEKNTKLFEKNCIWKITENYAAKWRDHMAWLTFFWKKTVIWKTTYDKKLNNIKEWKYGINYLSLYIKSYYILWYFMNVEQTWYVWYLSVWVKGRVWKVALGRIGKWKQNLFTKP